jgi:hypothetical protein
MFSWICPQCGREVPPSYTECPDCVAKGKASPPAAAEPVQAPTNAPLGPPPPPQPVYAAQPSQQGATAPYAPYPGQYGPPQPQYAPPPQQYPQQYAPTGQYPQQEYAPPGQYPQQQPYPPQQQYPQQQYAPPPQYSPQYAPPPTPAPRSGLPTWLLTVAFAAAFVGLVGGIYWLVGSSRGGQAASPPANVENPAAKPVAKTSPVQKYVEISGIRFTEDAKKKVAVRFLVTNHSDADLSGLAGNVTVWARTNKSEEEPVGTFSFMADVAPDASKEVTAPLTTKLKMYELPDWQNVTTDVQITAPQ